MNKEEVIRDNIRKKARPDHVLINEFMPLLEAGIERMTPDDAWPVSQMCGHGYWSKLDVNDAKHIGELVSGLVAIEELPLRCINPDCSGTKIYKREFKSKTRNKMED